MPTITIRKRAREKGVSVMKSESEWEKAKKLAKKSGHAENWPYISSIYEKKMSNQPHPKTHDKVAAAVANLMVLAGQRRIMLAVADLLQVTATSTNLALRKLAEKHGYSRFTTGRPITTSWSKGARSQKGTHGHILHITGNEWQHSHLEPHPKSRRKPSDPNFIRRYKRGKGGASLAKHLSSLHGN